MNTRTRTLQRMKKRASGSHVPKDYKELGERLDKKLEHIEKGLDQLHRHIDERLDRMVNFLHEIDERTRKTSDVSVWDIKQEHALRRSLRAVCHQGYILVCIGSLNLPGRLSGGRLCLRVSSKWWRSQKLSGIT